MSVYGHRQIHAGVFRRAPHVAEQRDSGGRPPSIERGNSLEHASGRGDAVGRDRHGSRGPAPDSHRERRPRSVIALARRPAGAFLLATLALLAFAPVAEAQAPSKVKDLTATAVSPHRIDLDWKEPDEFGQGFQYYQLRVRVSGGSWQTAGTISDSAATSSFVGGLNPATQYTLQVLNCATNNQCESGDTVSATTHHTPPNTPSDDSFAVFPAGDRKVQAIWGALGNAEIGTGNFERYRLQYKESTASDWSGATDETVTDRLTSFTTVTLPSISASYDFRLRAEAGGQHSAWTPVLTIAGKPGTPASLTISAVTATGATLTWTAVTATGGRNLQNYEYRWREKIDGQAPGAGWVSIRSTGSNTLTADVTGLAPATAYEFGVRATNGHRGSYFKIAEAMTDVDPAGPPGKVLNLRAAKIAANPATQIAIEWDAPAAGSGGTFAYYQNDVRVQGANWGSAVGGTGNIDTRRTIYGSRHPGTTYEFRVRACKSSAATNCGPWADTASATTDPIVPAVPGNVRASALNNDNDGNDRLEWNAVTNTGGVSYEVQRRRAGQSWEAAVAATGTQHDFAKASGTSGGAYDYRVRAKTSAGDGTWSGHVTVAGRPGSPSVTATASTSTVAVDLSWAAPSTGGKDLTGYRIEWREDASGDWTDNPATGNATAPGSATSATITAIRGLQPGTVYDFRIRADNPDRQSFYSTTAQANAATLSIGARISSPASLTEGELDGATLTVDLVGTEYVQNLTPQARHFSLDATFLVSLSSVNRVSDTRAELTLSSNSNISADQTIRVLVQRAAHTGSGQLSTAIIPVTAETAPAQVLTATATGGPGRVTVNWGRSPDADGYKVQWKGPGENYDASRQIVITDGATETAVIPGPGRPSLAASTAYTVRVIPTKRLAPDGTPSTDATATTDAVSALISSPSSLTERGLNGARLTVDLVGTQYVSSLTPGDFGLLPQGTAGLSVASADRQSGTRAVLTLAFDGNIATDLELQVAVDGSAHTSSGTLTTAGITVTQAPRPGRVTNVAATGGPGSLEVSWRAAPNADGYTVSWWPTAAPGDVESRRVEGGSTTRTDIGGLAGETGYSVRVVAYSNHAPDGTQSNTASATTEPAGALISATDPSPLTEDSLDGAKVTVEFLGRPNRVWHHVGVGQFTASGVPGVSVSGVELLSDRKARLTLAYDDTDFDDDRTLRIDIDGEAFDRYGTGISAITGVRAVVEAPPDRVLNVQATAGTERVRVTWDAVASSSDNPDVNVYKVQWKGPDGGWWRERRVRGSRTSYTIGAAPGTTYTVRVVATKRKAPDGPPSAEARATTPAFSYRVKGTDPVPLTGVNLDGATVTVELRGAEWNLGLPRHLFRLSGLETGVWVERVEHVSRSEARIVLAHRGPSITEDGELTVTIDADTYTYSRNGDLTVIVPVKAPGQAGGVRIAGMTNTTITVAWDRYEGGNRLVYEVRWRESASDGRWRGRRTTGTWYQIRDLEPGTEYTVQVRYWDRGGAGFGKWTEATMETPGGGLDTAQNQQAGVTIAADDPVPVDEGGEASYTVVLDGRPAGDVTIAMSSDNPDVTTQPASLTFTADDWYTPRTVTVRAAHDGDAANEAATLSHAVSGAQGYAGIAVASVAVAVTDDDGAGAGVTVSETELSLQEGGSATYTVVLDTPPAGDVVIHPAAQGGGLTAAPSELTFTPENWNQPQTVTVSAAQDDDAEDGQGFVTHSTLVAPGSAYAGVTVAHVAVSVADDEAVGQPAEEQPPWILRIVRNDQPFETVSETGADAEYPSTFLRLERGSSTAPLPAWLPVTVGGTAANPADYEFNHGNVFAGLSRQSADMMDGARKITVKGDGVAEGAETITFSVTIEGETLTATLTITDDEAVGQPAEAQPPWTLELVRNDQPFETVAETGADAEYPSTFLRLVRGTSTAPLPAWLPVTVGGTAANPEDYEFNHGNVFAGLSRQSADHMDGARKITVKGDGVAEGPETITFSVTIEGQTLTATLTITDGDAVGQPAEEPPPPWTLKIVREDRPFTVVAETDAEYPSTFLRLERGTSTAPLPAWLPVTVGGTAANPEDYEFNHGNVFAGLSRQSADHMDGARKITVKDDSLDEGAETITFSVTIEGQTLTATLDIVEDPLIAVADASVQEAAGASLGFRVTLAPAPDGPVTVDWATVDGSAVAGADYTAASGTLSFAAGETGKTVSVAVLDDDIDEGSETLTLRLSNATGAVLDDAEAMGTIGNTDLMPQAWLARFGRTVADQVIGAVTARFEAAPEPGSAVNIAGQSIGQGGSREAQAACMALRAADRERHGIDVLADGNRAGFASGTGGLEDRCRSETRTLTGRELLTGSSFAFTGGDAETGFGTVWGSGALTRFDGREGELSLDGDVASALLGADFRLDRATVGLALAHSQGNGTYSGAGSGEVESALTGVYPYGRYDVNQRLSLWGIAGYGTGTLTLTPDGGSAVETDTDMAMAAAGARGVLLESQAGGGPELAVTSDGLLLRMSSNAARDGAGGRLAASDADVARLRLGLEGTWRGIETGGGGTLTPTLEVGVRHDDGDAETGFGLEAGAGLAWSDPARGIAAELKAHGLLTHEADGFREHGLSGAFAWDPTPGSDRGPSLTLTQTLGASASDGVNALFREGAPTRLAANDAGGLDRRRFEARFGYGTGAFGDRLTMTPELGIGLSDGSRDYGVGWRLNRSAGDSSSFEVRVDATRREAAGGDAEPEHAIQLDLKARF